MSEEQTYPGAGGDFNPGASNADDEAAAAAAQAQAEADAAAAEADTTTTDSEDVAAETPQSEIDDGSVAAREAATKSGWPAETVDGETVMIVGKESTPAGDKLTADDGTAYGVLGDKLVELDADGRLPREEEEAA